jgi:hypothetical protein
VHRLKAGLWGRAANITQVADDGDWGKVFQEAPPGEPGLPAYSVADVAARYNISAFDYVKIDIEGGWWEVSWEQAWGDVRAQLAHALSEIVRFCCCRQLCHLPSGRTLHFLSSSQPPSPCVAAGAEGMVFDPSANTSWVRQAKLISLEAHDFFAQHFGLKVCPALP